MLVPHVGARDLFGLMASQGNRDVIHVPHSSPN